MARIHHCKKYMLKYVEKRGKIMRDIIGKCKDQPKLFYRYVIGKLKNKHVIEKLNRDSAEYSEDLEMAEVMNEHFQAVFTRESDRNEEKAQTARSLPMREIEVSHQEIMNQLKNLDARKSHGPDGVANWIPKECREELVDKVHNII